MLTLLISQIPTNELTEPNIFYNLFSKYLFEELIMVASAVVVFLIKELRALKKERNFAIAEHIKDLKEQKENILNLSERKTSSLVNKLENQISKLEVLLSNFNKR